jgi:hypothetical protein
MEKLGVKMNHPPPPVERAQTDGHLRHAGYMVKAGLEPVNSGALTLRSYNQMKPRVGPESFNGGRNKMRAPTAIYRYPP